MVLKNFNFDNAFFVVVKTKLLVSKQKYLVDVCFIGNLFEGRQKVNFTTLMFKYRDLKHLLERHPYNRNTV